MTHWHLTTGETAFFAPFGVILGAAVAYVAARKSARDGLAAQRLSIDAARELAEVNQKAGRDREQRDHRRTAYAELGGQLQVIDDNLNYLVGPMLQTSTASESEWDHADSTQIWSAFYAQILDAMPDCRKWASVYGSPEIRAAVQAISMFVRVLAPPAPFAKSPGHWMHALRLGDGGVQARLVTVGDGGAVRDNMHNNITIVQDLVRYALAQARHELLPEHEPKPQAPAGLAVSRPS
jgi:hypothetical protein